MFQKGWTNSYFFVEISDKPVCLVCDKHVAAKKKWNLGRHYDSYHGYLKKLSGQVRQDKIEFLKSELRTQQTPLRKYCETNNYRLLLYSRLCEESPAWFCSHLLAMIQACTCHSAIFVKPQQWPTPSESIAIYCVRKLVSWKHIFNPAQKSTYETKKKLRTVAKTKIQKYKNWRLPNFSTIAVLPLNTATTLLNEPRSQRPFRHFCLTKNTLRVSRGLCRRRARGLQQKTVTCSGKSLACQLKVKVSSGGKVKWIKSVKKFTFQLRCSKLISISMLKITSNNSKVIPCLSKFFNWCQLLWVESSSFLTQ